MENEHIQDFLTVLKLFLVMNACALMLRCASVYVLDAMVYAKTTIHHMTQNFQDDNSDEDDSLASNP